MGVFSKCQIALDLDTSVPFKRKAAIKRQIIDNDGVISYIVSKKVMHPFTSVPLHSGRVAEKSELIRVYKCLYCQLCVSALLTVFFSANCTSLLAE